MEMKLYNFDFSKKIFYHPEKIVEYRDGSRPFPILVEVDLTNKCNHRCKFCCCAEHINTSRDSMDSEIIQARLAEARELGTKAISFTGGGEPMMHKDFLKILQYAKALGLDAGMLTNGSAINEKNVDTLVSNLEWIRISVGGGDQESYTAVQGIDHFERVLRGINLLAERRRELKAVFNIGVRLLVLPENVDSITSFARLLKDARINYLQLAPDQFTDDRGKFWNDPATKQHFEEAGRILEEANTRLLTANYVWLQDRIDFPRTCYAHFFHGLFLADGNVAYCRNAHGKEDYYIGNINKNTLAEIWSGDRTKEIEGRVKPSNCALYCKNMALNVTMEEVLYPDPDMSPNFVG
ncbi:radical SAM protein [Candidatus Hydrogenedentota bacterium]